MPVEVERLQGELPKKVEIGNVDDGKKEAVSSEANQEVTNGISHGGNDNGNGNGNCNGEDKEEADGSYVFVTENDTVGDDPVVSDPYPDAIVEKDGDGVARGENENSGELKMENGEPVESSVEVSQEGQVVVEAVVEITKSEIEGPPESRDGDLDNGEGKNLESIEEVEQIQDSEVEPRGLQEESEGQINTDQKIDVQGDQRNPSEGQDKSNMDLDFPKDEGLVETNVGRESELVCNETSLEDPKDDNLSLGKSVQDSGSTFNVSESARVSGSEDDGIGSESTAVVETVSVERDGSEMESDVVKVSAADKNGDVQMVSEAENAHTSVERDDIEMESEVVKVSTSDEDGDVQMGLEAENTQTSIERDDIEMESDVVKVSASDKNGDVQMVPEAEAAQTSHDADTTTELDIPNVNGDVKEETQNLTVPSLDEDASKRSESQVIEVQNSVSDEGAELEPEAVDIPASDERSDAVGLSEENLLGTANTDGLSCTNQQEPEYAKKSELVEIPSPPSRLEATPNENGTNGRGSSELDINQDMKDESIAEVSVDADVSQTTVKEAENSTTGDFPGNLAHESSESLSRDLNEPLSGLDSEATVSELAENSANGAADEMDTTAFEPEVEQLSRTCSEPHVDLPTPEHSTVDIEVENDSKVNGTVDIPKVVCDDTKTEEVCEAEVANIKESSVMNAAEEVESGTTSFYFTEFPLLSNGKVNADTVGEPKEKDNKSSWATAFFASKTKTSARDLEPEAAISTDTTHTGKEDAILEAVVDSQLAENKAGSNVIEDGIRTSISFEDEKARVDVQTELIRTTDTADVTDAKVASTCEDSDGPSGKLQVEGETQKDQASTSSGEVSAPDASEGQAAPADIERKPFFFLPRVPRYDDEKLAEQLKHAEEQVDQKTQSRDAIRAEMHEIKVSCKECDASFKAANAEERSARKALHSKRQEIESLQSVINRVKSAMSVDEIDSKVRSMEHIMQHETLHLNEEKQLLREIKQLKQRREQISSNMGTQDEVQQALDDKEKTEERLKALRKELDMLRNDLSKAEVVAKAARKRYDEEWEKQSKLQEQFRAADAVRQEAFVHLQSLRKQLKEKNKYFFKCRDDLKAAIEMASKKDRDALQSFCFDNVETFMNLWNNDDEFRKYYVRCNTRSTLRRLGTLDGRSLGPDEEPTQIPHARSERADKLRASNVRPEKHETVPSASAQQEKVIRLGDVKSENAKAVAKKPIEQKNQTTKSKKPAKPTPPQIATGEEIEESTAEEEERPKLTREEEELLRKAEEKRKQEEAAKLKEQLRLEEIAKAKEAMERKKKREEKAKARAALRTQKEAEEKEKEREKKLRKKERKSAAAAASSREDATTQSPESPLPASDTRSETPKELSESSEKQISATNQTKKPHKTATQFLKQTKPKSIPPPLRNRSNKRRLKQYMWVVLVVLVAFVVFLLGNSNLSFSPANLWFLI